MSNPEELLTQILKANKKIAFGQTLGINADGNCSIQTDDGSILARSPDQISAGSAIALKSDDGQWYAVSAREAGTVRRSKIFGRRSKPILEEKIFFNLPLSLLRVIPFSSPLNVIFLAEWVFFENKPEDGALQNQLWTQDGEVAEDFTEWDEPEFPTLDLPSRNIFNGVWSLSFGGGIINPVDPNTLTYSYSANEEWIEFTGFFGGSGEQTFGYFLSITFFADPVKFPFIQGIARQSVTNDSEIEAEIETNVGTIQDIFYENFGNGFFGFSINSTFPGNASISSNTYSFKFRYRRRVTDGDPLLWFQL